MEHLQKTRKRYKNSKKQETKVTSIRTDELDKASFQHNMAYGAYKDLHKGKASDKICDKAFAIAVIRSIMSINGDSPQWYTNFLTKLKKDTTTIHTGTGIISEDQRLANELHKSLTRNVRII